MPLAHSIIGSAPMLAKGGVLVIGAGVVLAVVLAVYAIYWMIFRMGKD